MCMRDSIISYFSDIVGLSKSIYDLLVQGVRDEYADVRTAEYNGKKVKVELEYRRRVVGSRTKYEYLLTVRVGEGRRWGTVFRVSQSCWDDGKCYGFIRSDLVVSGDLNLLKVIVGLLRGIIAGHNYVSVSNV